MMTCDLVSRSIVVRKSTWYCLLALTCLTCYSSIFYTEQCVITVNVNVYTLVPFLCTIYTECQLHDGKSMPVFFFFLKYSRRGMHISMQCHDNTAECPL
ncbi:uncharacterized protein B0J16DRAFT_339760 [Fusarium flagelliforme]|uniref:uncharacterized protein n=1 Tax=Fusarium flagelliforme TaxID=2675880 RepID=UPI001E8DAD71|nr:uncharacterized protein B0J16DRAFT_339760 [Fusarium flagelliforme]KAH7189493.1 hypothetical protein B0J16DRAFT_339760 [Fusarium flagelliforme]